MSVLLCAAETWTLLSCDKNILEAIHMKWPRQILDIGLYVHWTQHIITNAEVLSTRIGLPSVMEFIRRRRLSQIVSIWRHFSHHSGGSSTRCHTLSSRPGIQSFTWPGLETYVDLVVLALAGQTNFVSTLDLFLPTCRDYGTMVERRDGLSWLMDV